MKEKKITLLAKLALVAATIIWGSSFIIVKDVTDSMPPSPLLAIRFLGASALLSLIFHRNFKRLDKWQVLYGSFFGLLLFKWLTAGLGAEHSLLVSVVLARVVSAAVNFAINKTVVFHSKGDWKRELGKYAVLAVCILIVNYYLLRLLTITLHWPLIPAKLLVEVVLICVNFLVQGRIVYRRKKKA